MYGSSKLMDVNRIEFVNLDSCTLTLLVGWQKGHPGCKNVGMVEVGTA